MTYKAASVLVFSLSIILSSGAFAANAESGPLSPAKQKISASAVVGEKQYSSMISALNATLLDGPKSLKLLKQIGGSANAELSYTVSEKNRIAVGLDKYEGVQMFLMDNKNNWAFPLFDYTQGGESDEEPVYVRVNTDLRDTKPDTAETVKWVRSMRSALSKLPSYEGITFRGTRLTPDRIEKYYPTNGMAVDAAFLSTSISPNIAIKFATSDNSMAAVALTDKTDGKVAIIFIINGRSGRPVSSFAIEHSGEEEILFGNGTQMKVIAKTPIFEDKVFGKTIVIRLQEL